MKKVTKSIALAIVTTVSLSASAKVLEISSDLTSSRLSKPVLYIYKEKVVTICKAGPAARTLIEEKPLVALLSTELSNEKGAPMYVIGSPAPEFDAGFNHWRYACSDEDKIDVTQQWRVQFVLQGDPEVIYLEVPKFISESDIKIKHTPQPMHAPIKSKKTP